MAITDINIIMCSIMVQVCFFVFVTDSIYVVLLSNKDLESFFFFFVHLLLRRPVDVQYPMLKCVCVCVRVCFAEE